MALVNAKPYPYAFGKEKPVLLIIDMQRDFLEEGGFGALLGNDVTPLRKIIPTVEKLLKKFRQYQLPVIHTREAHKADLSDCPPAKRARGDCKVRIGDESLMGRVLIDGEPGNAIIKELKPIKGEFELTKPGKGAFYDTSLQNILKELNATHLIVSGVTTEVCVQTTMREANDRGYECLLVEDATESYFPEFKKSTLDMIIAQGGIVGWVADSASVIKILDELYA